MLARNKYKRLESSDSLRYLPLWTETASDAKRAFLRRVCTECVSKAVPLGPEASPDMPGTVDSGGSAAEKLCT